LALALCHSPVLSLSSSVIVQAFVVNLMLSPHGINDRGRREATINICTSCHNSLLNGQKQIRTGRRDVLRPPKFAIANGFWIGLLPADLQAASIADLAVVTPFRKVARLVYLQCGRQRQLRSHVYSTRLDVQEVVRALPLRPSSAQLKVLLAGPFTPPEREASLRPVKINREIVRGLLRFWKDHANPCFASISIDHDLLDALPAHAVPAELVRSPVGNVPYACLTLDCPRTADDFEQVHEHKDDFGSLESKSAASSTDGPTNLISSAAIQGLPQMMATTVVSGLGADSSVVASMLRSAGDGVADPSLGPDDAKLRADRPPRTFYEVPLREPEFGAILARNRTVDVRRPIGQLADVRAGDTIMYRCGSRAISCVISETESYSTLSELVDDQPPERFFHNLTDSKVALEGLCGLLGAAPDEGPFIALSLRGVISVRADGAYRIKPSADRVWDSDPEWWLKAFPHLFPFGRGGPNEARRTRVSVEACMEHYLRLSTGQFQGYEFALHGYDVVARQQLGRRAYLQTKLRHGGARVEPGAESSERKDADPSDFAVNARDLTLAAAVIEEQGRALRLGRRPPPMPSTVNPSVTQLVRNVKVCAAAAKHTYEHSQAARLQMFAMHYCFGMPTYWYVQLSTLLLVCSPRCCVACRRVTVAPDDLCSVDITAIGTGAIPSQMPNSSVRFNLLAERPGAAALHFERVVDVVIKYVCGWSRKHRRPYRYLVAGQKSAGGLLGVTRAFAGAVEDQARGSLHLHLVVWVAGQGDIIERLRAFQRPIMDAAQRSISNAPAGAAASPSASPTAASSAAPMDVDDQHAVDVKALSAGSPVPSTAAAMDVDEQPAADVKASSIGASALSLESNQLLDSIRRSIDSVICAELPLTAQDLEWVSRCPNAKCGGLLRGANDTEIARLR
jgi:ASC-1-like (ASCH) protein